MISHNGVVETGLTTAEQDAEHSYRRLVKAVGAKEAKLKRKMWDNELPHFGGNSPHRYDINGGSCVYCFKPQSYRPKDR